MTARWGVVLLMAAAGTSPAMAQAPAWQFRWEKGQVLTCKVHHVTHVSETAEGSKVESSSTLDLVKRWQVIDIDAQGTATLQLTLAAMRHEQKRPDGESLLFDSANPAKSTPELREQMTKYIGKTLAVLRIDALGRVLEVKQGSASRYEAEPPFVLVFPRAVAQEGQVWSRPFTITLEPPQGTGQKYQAQQRYQCTKIADGKAVLSVKTELKSAPESAQDRLPLLPREVEGQVTFDLKTGTLVRAALRVDRTVENHQGAGSNYRFRSDYTEEVQTGPIGGAVTPVRGER